MRDEAGLTTAGMAVALLLSLALVFSGAQVYRVNTAAAEIQEVADAAALAAENPVAEFMVAVRLCDAVALSLSLLGLVTCGAGVVALCVPPCAEVGAKLIDLGTRVLKARNAFAERAAAGLSRLQTALPFLAAANAAAVGAANGRGGPGGAYLAAAVLVSPSGAPIRVGPDDAAQAAGDAVGAGAAEVERAAAAAEEAARAAQEAKARAFERDCGANPSYCLYERAAHLAVLDEASNPLYRSVDAWSFSVPLKRARAYYAARRDQERPASGSTEERARSALRKLFYGFAAEQLAQGYVRETAGSFGAYFPPLPRNADEMRGTALFSRVVFPITGEGDERVMHAWDGCPNAEGARERGSAAQWERGGFAVCGACEFTAASLGNVAAASTSIDNGFEYHYAAIAQAAADYQEARRALDPEVEQAKGLVRDLIDGCAQAARSAADYRIKADPPGSKGAVALVVGTGGMAADGGFASLFVRGGSTLGVRAAVSGATLVADSSPEGRTVITSLLDGFGRDGGAAVGAGRIVLDCWSGLLRAYADGQQALVGAVGSAAGSLPLVGASGLGTWASGALQDAFAAVGLQPVALDALRPVVVNSAHVAAADEGRFAVTYRTVREQALRLSAPTPDLFSSLALELESEALGAVSAAERGIEVARIELPVGGVSVPITLALPPAMADDARDVVGRCFEAVRSLQGALGGAQPWR
ncbi:MAG: molybdenum cofactor biosynthesis enzyme [Eggerthellaceae bacterium]|nr:molybdenum cofactor biosynthesis enzyme [Eggerthellaceae bacterium]